MEKQRNTVIIETMSDNITGKFSFLARQLPGMSVHYLNGLQYVDSGRQSDTFNTVFGIPSSAEDIEVITRHYRQDNKPAAWWFAGSPTEYHETLKQAGWAYEERDVGMYLPLEVSLTKPNTVLSRIEYCINLAHFQDFGRVLSAIFEHGNISEAENIRSIYKQAGEHSTTLANNLIHLVGYVDDEAVSTATIYLKDNIAGIFDIATPEALRNRGFGSEMFHQALQVAQQKKASICVLQASSDGLNIYKRAGFTPTGYFEVWNLSNAV